MASGYLAGMGLKDIVSRWLTAPYRLGIGSRSRTRTVRRGAAPKRDLVAFAMPPPELTVEQRRALQLLAAAPNGYAEAALRARGFTPTLLVGLAARGYAVAKPQTMRAAGKTFGFMRFVITDSGRRASPILSSPWTSPICARMACDRQSVPA
jgi:hypothetical protein